jgi:hypothetical protein
MSKFIVSKNLLNKFAHGESNCSKRRKFAHSKEKLLTKIKFAPSKNLLKKFAHRICSQHRKTAHGEKPCRLGWINTMAKCFVSSQSEHGAPLNGLRRNGWNVLGQTFLVQVLRYEQPL